MNKNTSYKIIIKIRDNIYKVIKKNIARLGLEPKLTVHETVVLTTTQSRFQLLPLLLH